MNRLWYYDTGAKESSHEWVVSESVLEEGVAYPCSQLDVAVSRLSKLGSFLIDQRLHVCQGALQCCLSTTSSPLTVVRSGNLSEAI